MKCQISELSLIRGGCKHSSYITVNCYQEPTLTDNVVSPDIPEPFPEAHRLLPSWAPVESCLVFGSDAAGGCHSEKR